MTLSDLHPEHYLFVRQTRLENNLRTIMGEEGAKHTGLDYYE